MIKSDAPVYIRLTFINSSAHDPQIQSNENNFQKCTDNPRILTYSQAPILGAVPELGIIGYFGKKPFKHSHKNNIALFTHFLVTYKENYYTKESLPSL